MQITRWNEASRALPVLALKSNYLDRWPNDWHCDIGEEIERVGLCSSMLLYLSGTAHNPALMLAMHVH